MKIVDNLRREILMRQGQSAFEKGSYDSALEKFTLAHNLGREYVFASLWMGFCLTELENYAEAQGSYSEAISKRPESDALKAFWAINYMDQGLDDEALRILSPLVSQPMVPKPVSDAYGLCLLRLGKIDEGYKALTSQSRYLGPFGISARVLSACELYLSEHIDISSELEENIDREAPEHPYLKIRTRIGDLFSGLAFWNKSKREAHKLLSQAEQAIDRKDYLTAKRLLESLIEIKPDKKVILASANLFVRMKEYSAALSILDSIPDEQKTQGMKLVKTLILLRLGDLEGAELLLNSISTDPDNAPEVSYLYGLLYLKQGLVYRARKMFENTLKVVSIGSGLDLTAMRLREVLRVYNLVNERTLGPTV